MASNFEEKKEKGDEWHKAMMKMFFLGELNQQKDTVKTPPNILMEVVSAGGLTGIKGVDPSCLVRVGLKEVHRTKTIWNDPDPIWTVLTGSLCLLSIPEEIEKTDEEHSVVVEVHHGSNQCIGIVTVPFKDVLKKNGEREEYPIRIKPGARKPGEQEEDLGYLALRFRKATKEDIDFFDTADKTKEKNTTNDDKERSRAGDIDFKKIRGSTSSFFTSKRGKDGVTLYKTQPCPDPANREETTWMSDQQLKDEALKPSTKWVEAGHGNIGKVYIEVIGCDNLVNLDVGLSDFTDSFAAIVFENSMVRSEVVYDCLNPRWMPWSSRAFVFNVIHPSSPIFLGLFDYDALGSHAPIGRVAINTSMFQSNTCYLLHYRLHNDVHQNDDRGKVIIRLRVEWKNEAEAVKKTFRPPPRFHINVETAKSLELLRYLCNGAVNMDLATMESIKIYARELMEYGSVICYLIDVMLGVLLWRGRAKLQLVGITFKIWFPIHSAVLFVSAALAIENPLLIPTILFYGLAWILLTIGYFSSTHPYPWQRCKSAGELLLVDLLGRRMHKPIHIEPNVGVEEAELLAKLDKVKAERVSSFLYDFMMVGLKVRRIYKKTSVLNIQIETEQTTGWSLLGNNLYYIHLFLFMLVSYLNTWRNFVNWRGFGAYAMSMQLLGLGTIFLVLPMQYALLWGSRLFVWVFLGPFMKVVDIMLIHPYYRDREELEANPQFGETNLDAILESEKLQQMVKKGRIAGEEALKLKDMREYKFGKYAQRIPPVDNQRKPNVPLPESTARPYLGPAGDVTKGFVDVEPKKVTWCYVPGQQLSGTMVLHHSTIADTEKGMEQETLKF